jgi:hypothetical protein
MPGLEMRQWRVTPKCMEDYTHYWMEIAGLGKNMGGIERETMDN